MATRADSATARVMWALEEACVAHQRRDWGGAFGGGDDPVIVMGRGSLTRLFSHALDQIGRANREVDGEAAFLAGANAIVERLS